MEGIHWPEERGGERLVHSLTETVDDSVWRRNCSAAAVYELEGQLSCAVSGDPELLRRAVENVLRNAIRYSPEHAPIEVALAEKPSCATITVRDYGLECSAELLTQIFEPFFQVEDDAREADTGNIGLGLSIAKRAVQLHQGTITAQNASPGLEVRITIPLRSIHGS